MAMLQYVRRCGARPVASQAATAPGPLPQRGPPTATGSTLHCRDDRQRMKDRYGARPVASQAATAPGPLPQRGPLTATGSTMYRRDNRQRMKDRYKATPLSEFPDTPLVFAQWNAEGVRRKKPELQNFLKKNDIDIICIQETHLTDAHRFFIRGYEPFKHDRAGHKGGLLTLVKNSIPAVELSRSKGETEYIAVKLLLPEREIVVVNCYSPSDKDLKLHTIPLKDEGLLILGDLNSHSPSWGYDDLNPRGEQIEDWMIDNRLILINKPDDKPTCLSRAWNTLSTPDLALATEDIQKKCQRKVEQQLGGSDHLPIILSLSSAGQPYTSRKEPSWNYKRANWAVFKDLTDTMCDDAEISGQNNISQNVDLLTKIILEAAKRSIPRGRRQDYKPYWSENLQKLHNDLNDAREELSKNPNPESRCVYNKAREAFDKGKSQEIQKSWHEKTKSFNMERDISKLWNLTKALNEDRQSTFRATVLQEENAHHTGKQDANLLAESFQKESSLNVPREKTADIRMQIKQELRKQTPSQTMSTDFTIHELNDAVRRLKNKKSPGKDGITNEMIKNLGKQAKQKLLEIFNQSWSTGVFPHAWKEATVIPVLKKGKNRHDKHSYRPISLLSCLGKTLERMVNTRLQFHLEKNRLINPVQSGFRKHRSTEDQIAYLTQEIENGFQQKMKTLAVFVDLSKAFDKVWKEGLLLKLLRKNVCGQMYSWIEGFLFQRSARVRLDGHYSNLVKLREGVPQGGVISPTLFVVFIDDIMDHLTSHISRALHADDLALWTASTHISSAVLRMQKSLTSISNWATEWMVTINRTKTEATCFSLSPKREFFSLKIDGGDLPQQDTPTYLGVKLDRKLTWYPHIINTENKAVKKLAIMKKLAGTKWGANSKILTQVYTGTVRPHIEYASTSWTTAAKTHTARLDKVQNSGLRLITGGMKTTPIVAMEKTAKLHSLEERREEKILRQCEKLKRLSSHPLCPRLKELTKNRLKRQSLNHLSKAIQRQHKEILPQREEELEMLVDFEEWTEEELDISLYLPGVGNKEDHSAAELKALTLETLDKDYHPDTWTHAYTDGSAEKAVKNGGGGVFVRFPDGTRLYRSVATGQLSTNFRAESCALLEAAQILNASESLSSHTVILTDCRSLLQSLQDKQGGQILQSIKKELQLLNQKTTLKLQWIPAHCDITGNEHADRLSKEGSRLPQTRHRISYQEVKPILKSHFHDAWKQRMGTVEGDDIQYLDRAQQVVLFRLRTGHCRLLSHLYRLKVSHTDECPCGTGPQTPEHILQTCPTYDDLRRGTWPDAVDLHESLWGSVVSLRLTADFALATNLTI